MLQKSSNITFILAITLSECHVTLQLPTLFPNKLKQKSVKRTNMLASCFLLQSAEHTYPVTAASVWFEVALAVLPFYSLKCLLSANFFAHLICISAESFYQVSSIINIVLSLIFLLPLIHYSTKTD